MNNLLGMVLNQVSIVGMSTVNSISRIFAYEPEEDIELFEKVNKKQNVGCHNEK